MDIYKQTGGRGTVGKKDVNRVGGGFVVGGIDVPRSTSRSIVSAFTSSAILLATDKHRAGVRCLLEESLRCRGSR